VDYFGTIAYGLAGCLQGFLCFRYRHWRNRFPAFFAYLTFHLVTYCVLYIANQHTSNATYAILYWGKRSMAIMFLILAAAEICSRQDSREKRRYLGLALGFTVALAQCPWFHFWIDNAATLLVCLPLLFLLWMGDESRITWWMGAGLAFWGIASTALQYKWGHADLRFLTIYAYLLSEALWIFGSFHANSEPRTKAHLQKQSVEFHEPVELAKRSA
jgi:hypothetical protein